MLERLGKGIDLIEKLRKLGVPLSQIILLCIAVIALWYMPGEIRQHWFLSTVLVALYEIGVLGLILGKAIIGFSAELWKEEFEKEAVKATATWLRAIPSKIAPGFTRRYNRQVVIDHEVFNVRGLGLINTFTLKLDQVFVQLKISPSINPNSLNPDPITARAFAQARSIWDFIRASKDHSEHAVALAIIGPPGCGKTTLLQHVAVTFASNRQRRYRMRAYTPILLFLRDHVATITSNPSMSLSEVIHQYFTSDRYKELKTPANWFERQMRRGKCLILLDGLDEVAQAEKRRTISLWVDQQLRRYPSCRYVITSRPQGYLDAPLERANVVEVQPFNNRQVKTFIENWYLANEIVSAGNKIDKGVRQRAKRESDDLLKRLAAPKASALNALTINPLLLTMITMVHRYRGALPGSRVELYREICEVLLGRWRQAKGVLDDTLTADQKRVVLMHLAAKMMEREIREIRTSDAVKVIRSPLKRVGVTGDAVKHFLNSVQASSGLLLERENDRWSFAHLTFQEYLTSTYWLIDGNSPANWTPLAERTWWHETLRQYAAQGDATSLVKACLEVNTITTLSLASDCLYEGRELDQVVRRSLEKRLIADLESDDPARRRLAAEVQLTRRLISFDQIDDRRGIDPEYLSCAEYQLFLDDVRQQGHYHQPDHWTELCFPRGEALQPIAGLRHEDATSFCSWLTERHSGGYIYRVPSSEEALNRRPTTTNIQAWCLIGDQPILVGGTSDKIRELEEELKNYLGADVSLELVNHAHQQIHAFKEHLKVWKNLTNETAVQNQLIQVLKSIQNNNNQKLREMGFTNACVLVGRLRIFSYRRLQNVSLERAIDQDITIGPDLDAGTRDMAFKLCSSLDTDFQPIVELAIKGNTTEALQMVESLQDERNPYKTRIAKLLGGIIALSSAERVPMIVARKGQREFFIKLLEARTDMQGAEWWLKIIVARENGKLPAWEGIRIVREKSTE